MSQEKGSVCVDMCSLQSRVSGGEVKASRGGGRGVTGLGTCRRKSSVRTWGARMGFGRRRDMEDGSVVRGRMTARVEGRCGVDMVRTLSARREMLAPLGMEDRAGAGEKEGTTTPPPKQAGLLTMVLWCSRSDCAAAAAAAAVPCRTGLDAARKNPTG